MPRASFYRRGQPGKANRQRAAAPPRALATQERQRVRQTLYRQRFMDKAPRQVYAALLDEGEYLCSVRTMYRLLAQDQTSRERRNPLKHPAYRKPELLAAAPGRVWSWDITKLPGPKQWTD